MIPENPVTVAQACRILGVSERTLRRILRQPEMAAQTLAEHRRTATGVRRAVLLTPELLMQVKQTVSAQNKDGISNSYNSSTNGGETQADAGENVGSLTLAYERLLAEQEARIVDLQAAVAHERTRSQQLAEALAAAQAEVAALQAEKSDSRNKPKTWRERLG